MRVAYVINQYPKVSHSFIRREIQALEAQGLSVDRYAIRGWTGDLPDEADLRERKNTRYVMQDGLLALVYAGLVCMAGSPRVWFHALALALRLSRGSERSWAVHVVYFFEACQLLQWWKRRPVRHVHAHFGTNPAEVVMLAQALGGPGYSFTVHGPEEFDKATALHLTEKMMNSRFVVAISSFGRSQLWRHLPSANWDSVKVVHCGLEKTFYAEKGVPVPAAPRLVCVGRLCEQKGQLLLLTAVLQLRDAGLHCELVLAGDGEMRTEIEQLIAYHGLQSQVRITGWISAKQVQAELLNARALVLPSFAEGLPVVIMEALAMRRPVLTTYVAGIPELVINHQHGWLFPAGDVVALAAAIRECLCADPADLQAMGEAGFARVSVRHDVDSEASKLLNLFLHSESAVG